MTQQHTTCHWLRCVGKRFARPPLQAPDPSKNMTADDEAYRRGVLARSRNFLLAEALRDEGWVLWLDVDIVQVRPPCSSIVIGQ